jgi:hypothetical protein
MATRSTARAARWIVTVASAVALSAPAVATATGPSGGGQKRIGGHVVGVKPLPPLNGPAGPTPLNPAGPTPLNPAGPPPIGAGGASIAFPRRIAPIQRPGFAVGIVGANDGYGAPLGGSFYCQVHDRGYASESLFFDHLSAVDGIPGDDALSYLIEDGGVWVFPVE